MFGKKERYPEKFNERNETGMVSRVNTGEIRSKIERVRVERTKIFHTILNIGDRCAIIFVFLLLRRRERIMLEKAG